MSPPLRIFLGKNTLRASRLQDLVRLASFLGLKTDRKESEKDCRYRERLAIAINRWEVESYLGISNKPNLEEKAPVVVPEAT